ncbi:ATP-binding cassette domain-containing protein [Thiolapillus brandeum]|uniref:ATP-binding cassette domain-containing protein n=1 Tax=Thiolapillus brandeum TaxID=1076588 RepID=UPI000596C7FB|nr:ATP-binding cassette domain-containing protein [Thiolapillus brandeum]
MSLLSIKKLSLSFGHPALLNEVDLNIEANERICLIGRNGEGKSTLMKVIAGEIPFDDGEVRVEGGARIAFLRQEVPDDMAGRIFDLVADGLGNLAGLVKDYHAACVSLAESGDEAAMNHLSVAQQKMEAAGGWALEQRVEEVISRMELDPDQEFSALSGGMKRRVLLARALAAEPDLLLLDEPTNHLDIEAIAWLEEFLLGWRGSLLFITHDRAFLRRLATRIVELDRGMITDWPGDYDNYLRRKAERENAEARENARFDKKLAQEEVWIRQGIKARRTRNEGRVRQLQAMREAARERRSKQGSVKLAMNKGELSGKLVCEAENVSYAWDGNPVVRNFSATILRGDKLGIIGPNGCGKSTLLNLLLGKLKPDAGDIRLGSKVEVAYFDQLRAQLDEEATVIDNVSGGSDSVTINGHSKHIISYLQDFLFPPARARQPVKALSGGERNRLLLAKLFMKPANLLVMDEPTNDLDVETLELLEELLLNYEGTLLLVSHDRAFLDNVVTSSLVFEGQGQVNAYVGGYSDWLAQRPAPEEDKPRQKAGTEAPRVKPQSAPGRKLGYKEQRELARLPGDIEAMEERRANVEQALSDPELYQSDPEKAQSLSGELQEVVAQLEALYLRWDELEEIQGG